MTFYNHIESARYEMFKLVNGWTREGAETKARISESLDQARREYMEMEAENARLREELESVGTAAYLYGRSDLKVENNRLRELAQRADRLLTDIFPYIDYSRCTALEAVAAWRVGARELGIEVDE